MAYLRHLLWAAAAALVLPAFVAAEEPDKKGPETDRRPEPRGDARGRGGPPRDRRGDFRRDWRGGRWGDFRRDWRGGRWGNFGRNWRGGWWGGDRSGRSRGPWGGPRFGPPRGARFGGRADFMADRLKLTDEQKRKLAELHKKMRDEFVKILTPEQKKMLEDRRGRGRGGPRGDRGPRPRPEEGRRGPRGESRPRPEEGRGAPRPANPNDDLRKQLEEIKKELAELRKAIKR